LLCELLPELTVIGPIANRRFHEHAVALAANLVERIADGLVKNLVTCTSALGYLVR
jgi:hypothetical protein